MAKKKKQKPSTELIKQMQGKVAVYIDAANLEKSVQELGLIPPIKNHWHVNYKKLHEFFEKNIHLASINFYTARFETKSHDRFLTFLKKNGYRLVTKRIKSIWDRKAMLPRRCRYCSAKNEISTRFKCVKCKKVSDISLERKADFDVEISVDAVGWVENYDTFILFSGDSDFVYLTEFLKKQGKTVVVLSRRGHIADELRKSPYVDYYEDIYKLKSEFLRHSSYKKPNPACGGTEGC